MKKFLTLTLSISLLLISNSLFASSSSKGNTDFFKKAWAYAKPVCTDDYVMAVAIGLGCGTALDQAPRFKHRESLRAYSKYAPAGFFAVKNRGEFSSKNGLWKNLSVVSKNILSPMFLSVAFQNSLEAWRNHTISQQGSQWDIAKPFLLCLATAMAGNRLAKWQKATNNESC